MLYPIPHLDPSTIKETLKKLIAAERHATAELIEWLIYAIAFKSYLREGYSSLFEYLAGEFGLTRNQAYKRAAAAKIISNFPALMAHLRGGQLTLSHLVVLSGSLTKANYEAIIPKTLNASIEQTKKIVASTDAEGNKRSVEPLIPLQLNLSAETRAKLARVRELLASRPEGCSAEGAIDAALELYLEKHDPIVKAKRVAQRGLKSSDAPYKTDRSKEQNLFEEKAPASDSRYIPAGVRHMVMLRDQGQCSFVSSDGKRCEGRAHLEFDHVKPFALGGSHNADNVRLLCRAHNQMMADDILGEQFMRQKRNEALRWLGHG